MKKTVNWNGVHAMEKEKERGRADRAELGELLADMFGDGENSPGPLYSTGCASLDKALGGGLYKGLNVLAGMPGAGKTTLAAQVFAHGYTYSCDRYYYDLENDGRAVNSRFAVNLANRSGATSVTLDSLHDPSGLSDGDAQELISACEFVADDMRPCTVSDMTGDSVGELLGEAVWQLRHDRQRARDMEGIAPVPAPRELPNDERSTDRDYDPPEWFTADGREVKRADVAVIWDRVPREGKSLVVVDSLQMLDATAYPKDPVRRIDAAVGDLRHMVNANEGPVCVLAVSTLSRDAYKSRGSMGAAYGSSAIEYAAESVVSLSDATPEEVAALGLDAGLSSWMESAGARVVVAHVSKNRHGRQGVDVPLVFDPLHARFFGVPGFRA